MLMVYIISPSIANLRNHMRVNHKESDLLKCKACNFQTSTLKSLKQHERTHSGRYSTARCHLWFENVLYRFIPFMKDRPRVLSSFENQVALMKYCGYFYL